LHAVAHSSPTRRSSDLMRRALGAGRLRIVRQILTESLMLAICAGAASLLLAHWALLGIVRFGPKDIPRLASVGLNTAVLTFTLGDRKSTRLNSSHQIIS